MKKIAAVIILMAVLTGWYAHSTVTSGEIDIMCRNKAKEAATEAYRGCVTENKTAQIEQIRKEYKEQLKALKEKYDGELQNVAGGTSSVATAASGAQSNPAPAKKSAQKSASTKSNKKITKRQQKHVEMDFTQESQEQAPEARSSGPDDSKMDLPEPIPVEDPGATNN